MNMEAFKPADCGGASLERIKELSMSKIKNEAKGKGRALRVVFLVAAAVAALSITAAAVSGAWGIRDTSGLSRWEIKRLLRESNTVSMIQLVAPDGSVSYMDGNEVLFTLSAEESAAYDAALRAERQQKMRESTDKLDLDTLELFPNQVQEISANTEGGFGDFLLTNGSTVILCGSDGDCFPLKAGDEVSLTVTASGESIIRYGLVKDGVMLEEVSLRSSEPSHTFAISDEGEYCFTLSYYSAGADNFTDGKIVIG